MLGFLLTTALFAAQSSPTDPIFLEDRGLEMVVRRRFYGIEGRNFSQAQTNVFARQLGFQWAASTSYNISAEWYLEETEAGCELTSAFLSSHLTIELPHWVDVQDASRRSQRQWQELSTRIQTHEHGHVNLAFYGMARARDLLEALPPAENCDRMAEIAGETVESVQDWTRRNQREYDRLSDHGQDQEAVADWVPHDDAVGRLPE